MRREALAAIVQEGGRLLTGLLQLYVKRPPPRSPLTEPEEKSEQKSEQKSNRVTTDETIEHQKRAIAKELLLLEGHLQESCKIAGKAFVDGELVAEAEMMAMIADREE